MKRSWICERCGSINSCEDPWCESCPPTTSTPHQENEKMTPTNEVLTTTKISSSDEQAAEAYAGKYAPNSFGMKDAYQYEAFLAGVRHKEKQVGFELASLQHSYKDLHRYADEKNAEIERLREALDSLGKAVVMGQSTDIRKALLRAREALSPAAEISEPGNKGSGE